MLWQCHVSSLPHGTLGFVKFSAISLLRFILPLRPTCIIRKALYMFHLLRMMDCSGLPMGGTTNTSLTSKKCIGRD